MSLSRHDTRMLLDLFDRLIEGQLSDDEQANLAQRLRDDADARKAYIRYVHQHADLAHLGTGLTSADSQPSAEDNPFRAVALRAMRSIAEYENGQPLKLTRNGDDEREEQSAKARARRWRRLSRKASLAAAIVVLAGVLSVVFFQSRRGPSTIEQAPTVATIEETFDAVWSDEAKRQFKLGSGTELPAQSMTLDKGMATLAFAGGARVTLDARQEPVRFSLTDASLGALHAGRLTALVDERARGFAVRCPGFRVVDLGTEFGIVVPEQGPAEVHVFKGRVSFQLPTSDGKSFDAEHAKEMNADDAITIALSDPPKGSPSAASARHVLGVQTFAADDRPFVRVPLDETLAQASKRSPVLDDASAAHLPSIATTDNADPLIKPDNSATPDTPAVAPGSAGLLAWYTFDAQATDAPNVIVNRAGSGGVGGVGGASDGVLSGATLIDGRRAGNRAALFGQGDATMRIDVPGSYSSMTLAAWVRVDGAVGDYRSLVLSDGWHPGDLHWQFYIDGRLGFSINRVDTAVNDHMSPAKILTPNDVGRWMHVATVFDAAAGQVVFYRDGQRVGATPIRKQGDFHIGSAHVGGWINPPRTDVSRPLKGAIDDLVIIGRASTDAEVAALYRADGPPATTTVTPDKETR